VSSPFNGVIFLLEKSRILFLTQKGKNHAGYPEGRPAGKGKNLIL
jgi:hypothetical protein